MNVEGGPREGSEENLVVGMIKILYIHVSNCQRINKRYSKT